MSQTKVQLIDGFDINTSVPADSLVIDSSGNVGIGNSNPSSLLTLGGNDTTGSSQKITYKAGSTDAASIEFVTEEGGINRDAGIKLNVMQNNSLFTLLYAEGTNGGRVGIGTTSPEELVHINASSSGALVDLLKIDNSGGATGTEAGIVFECGVDRTARISSENTGSDLGALKFWTAGSVDTLSERMRITSLGDIRIGTTSQLDFANLTLNTYSTDSNGIYINQRANGGFTGMIINRTTSDGDLITFLQAGTTEGAISVSGTTVTYGGGHLARWSQLPNEEDPSGILKGTVMSNLDEMCDWGDEDNEQLNKTKISDVEGDKNVSGVFVSVSPSEDGPLDFFVGMTGDMVIRIAEGVTVERGDLLMSAGDGTAKPQADDLVRSCTVAKVISTNVSCTHPDGSYCVPCVLMAC